jgi:hypothetical protein
MTRRLETSAAWILFALAAIKIILVVSASPVVAYANNWDFARQSSCYGVWESYPDGKDKTAFNFDRPVNPLRYDGDRRPEWCLQAIDNVFVSAALAPRALGENVDLRTIGLGRAAFILGMSAWLMRLARRTRHKLAIAAILLLAFGDIAYLAFFNTLYAEFSMLAGCFLSVMSLMLIVDVTKPQRQLIAFSAVALLFFGLSKAQYMPLASVCALAFAGVLWRKRTARAVPAGFLALAIAMPIVFTSLNPSSKGIMAPIKVANIMDTFMVAVLPNTRDPKASLSYVGLPEHCTRALGVSWYDPGVAGNLPCPEIANTSRTQLIRLFIKDPTAFFNPMRLAIQKVRPATIYYLGIAETQSVKTSIRLAAVEKTSLSRAIDALPPAVFMVLVCGSLAAALGSLLYCSHSSSALLLSAGGAVIFYALISSVFGDGFMEISKHATAIFLGFTIQLGAIFLLFTTNSNEEKP